MNKRLLSLVLAIALAGAGTFVVLSYVRGADERAVAGQTSVEVLVVQETIPKGTPAESVGDFVKTAFVPATAQATGSVGELDSLEGTVAAVDLLPGEQVVAARFVAPQELAAATRVEIPSGLLEVSISLEPQRAVGGQPRPGETVSVFASFDPFQEVSSEPAEGEGAGSPAPTATPSATHLLLPEVLITNIQVAPVATAPTLSGDEDEAELDAAPGGDLLVTLALAPADAEKLIFSIEHGTVYLARVNDQVVTEGTSIQTRDSVYR